MPTIVGNNCWHFNIYEYDKLNIREFESIFQHFSFYEQLKFHAQFSLA